MPILVYGHTAYSMLDTSIFTAPCAVVQAAAFAVEGHPQAFCNGSYRPRGQHEGWPRFENEQGMHLFRYRPDEQWFLETAFTPESDACAGYIATAEGPIPTGAQRWMWGDGSMFHERTVTVTALVSALRSCRPSHWALIHLGWQHRSNPIGQKQCSGEVSPLQVAICAWLLGTLSPI